MRILTVLLLVSVSLPVIGTPLIAADGAQVWTKVELQKAADKLAAGTAKIAGLDLGKYADSTCAVFRRTSSGEAELHEIKTDLLVIEQGNATFVTGGSIPDQHTTAPHEIRGSSIRGGVGKQVGPGDIIRVAAGTPHQFLLSPGQTITYFALKLNAK